MLRYQFSFLIGTALVFTFNLQSISAAVCSDDYFEAVGLCFLKNSNCPDGTILFDGKCLNIFRGYCNTSELWINDKCCTIDCLINCPNGNCLQCCNIPARTEPPLTNCSNQPIAPYPVEPIKPILPPTSGCPNQPVTPYPLVSTSPVPPTSNQPCGGEISCSQTTCTQNCVQACNQPCSTNCIQQTFSLPFCPTSFSKNCCNQSTCSQNCVNNRNQPCLHASCCSSSSCSGSTNCNPHSSCHSCCPTGCAATPPPSTTLPSITTTPSSDITQSQTPPSTEVPHITTSDYPPASHTKCPSGTILLGRTCHLIHCPRGSIMKDNHCVFIECPEGTVWTGYRCSMPEPIAQNLTFYNTVISKFNQSKPDIILNNTNNIVVNASISLQEESSCNYDDDDCGEDISTKTPLPQPSTKPIKCCEVMTPRICEPRNNRWHCYSRRYHRCGDFCITPIIYLRPPRVQVRPACVVMPPLQKDCHLYGNCEHFTGGFDCSGCGTGYMERCSYYCYRYTCPSQRCNFVDQEEYCLYNAGSYGCQEEDGCYDDWCQ